RAWKRKRTGSVVASRRAHRFFHPRRFPRPESRTRWSRRFSGTVGCAWASARTPKHTPTTRIPAGLTRARHRLLKSLRAEVPPTPPRQLRRVHQAHQATDRQVVSRRTSPKREKRRSGQRLPPAPPAGMRERLRHPALMAVPPSVREARRSKRSCEPRPTPAMAHPARRPRQVAGELISHHLLQTRLL